MRLGKQPPRHDTRTLKLARYVSLSTLPTPPASTNRREGVTLGMFGNDVKSDCTWAGKGNLRRVWAHCTGRPQPVTDPDVIDGYLRFTGGADNGCVELDVLNDWRKTPFAGETIDAYTAVNIHDDEQTRAAIWIFDGIYGGYALPDRFRDALNAGQPLTDDLGDPNPDLGHCMIEVDYDDQFVYLGTWGRIWPMTWAAARKYRDEGYAIIASLDQLDATGKTVEGFDVAALQADLAALA